MAMVAIWARCVPQGSEQDLLVCLDPGNYKVTSPDNGSGLDARWAREFHRGSRQLQGVEELPKDLEDGMIGPGDARGYM